MTPVRGFSCLTKADLKGPDWCGMCWSRVQQEMEKKPQSQCAQTPRACRQRQGLTQRHSVAGKRYKESRRRGRSRAVSSLGLLGRRGGGSARQGMVGSSLLLFSLVLDKGLHLVYQLPRYSEDVLHVVALGHLC